MPGSDSMIYKKNTLHALTKKIYKMCMYIYMYVHYDYVCLMNSPDLDRCHDSLALNYVLFMN
jgi:hypothetical protein